MLYHEILPTSDLPHQIEGLEINGNQASFPGFANTFVMLLIEKLIHFVGGAK